MQKIDKCYALTSWKVIDSMNPIIKEMDKMHSMLRFSSVLQSSLGQIYGWNGIRGHIFTTFKTNFRFKKDAKWMMKENKMGIFNKNASGGINVTDGLASVLN